MFIQTQREADSVWQIKQIDFKMKILQFHSVPFGTLSQSHKKYITTTGPDFNRNSSTHLNCNRAVKSVESNNKSMGLQPHNQRLLSP